MSKERSLLFRINMVQKLPTSLGTPEGPEFLRLDNASDIEYLLRLRKKVNILKKLDPEKVENITLPRLEAQLENLDKRGTEWFDLVEGAPSTKPEDEQESPATMEQKRLIEWPEYGPLSRLDVSIIAKNFLYNKPKIDEYLETKGILPLEKEKLEKLVNLTGNITVIPSNITEPAERSARILKMREEAKTKIKNLLLDPNFEFIAQEICEKD